MTHQKLRCYVLLAFNGQTTSEAVEHLENVWTAGFVPHAQLFQPPDKWIEYDKEWLVVGIFGGLVKSAESSNGDHTGFPMEPY